MGYGYSGYRDAREERISGLGGIGQIAAPFAYVPDLLPVGSGNAYFPRDTTQDARALNFLGFMSDSALDDHPGSLGTQARDIAEQVGAWDPVFRAAVTRAQTALGLTVDSWIGPKTRTALLAAVTKKNAGAIVPPAPPGVLPVNPGSVPGGAAPIPGATPVKDNVGGDDTMTYVAIGGGVVALALLGWLAFGK